MCLTLLIRVLLYIVLIISGVVCYKIIIIRWFKYLLNL